MRTYFRKAQRNTLHVLVLCLALPVTAGIGWVTWELATRLFAAEVATRAQALLSVQSATLESQLDKFRLLPPLLAMRPDIRDIILDGDRVSGERVAAIVAGMAGAREVTFLDTNGTVVASSHLSSRIDPGREEVVDPMPLAEALQGRLGRAYRRGTDGAPGSYVFASAVRDGPVVIGVVAVRVSLVKWSRPGRSARRRSWRSMRPARSLRATGRTGAGSGRATGWSGRDWRGCRKVAAVPRQTPTLPPPRLPMSVCGMSPGAVPF